MYLMKRKNGYKIMRGKNFKPECLLCDEQVQFECGDGVKCLCLYKMVEGIFTIGE